MKVLLAIDGSRYSDVAVAEVARRPWPAGTDVKILTVIHPTVPLFPDPAFAIAAIHVEQAEDLRHQAQILLGTACEQIRHGAPNVRVILSVVEGVPKHLIVQEASEWGADLIVVGSHGYGWVRSVLLGSVARSILTEAPCSVLVARVKSAAHGTESARSSEAATQCLSENALRPPVETEVQALSRSDRNACLHSSRTWLG
jgi:nucleotide-binding universal stress UspA family protein